MSAAGESLKARHNRLVRASVQAVGQLQALCDDAMPAYVVSRIEAVLEVLHRGMVDQEIVNEEVIIEVLQGMASVAFKTPCVEVRIIDRDLEAGESELAQGAT